MPDTAPLVTVLENDLDATIAGADAVKVIGTAPFAGTVTAVTYAPTATLTGANTESRTVAVVNKGTDGNGTAAVASKAFVSGTDAADFDETAITLSGTPANLVVAAGDVLAATSTHVGATGLADPGGTVRISLTRS